MPKYSSYPFLSKSISPASFQSPKFSPIFLNFNKCITLVLDTGFRKFVGN